MLTSFTNSITFRSKITFLNQNFFSFIINKTIDPILLKKTNVIPKRYFVNFNYNSFWKYNVRSNYLINLNNGEKFSLKTYFHTGILFFYVFFLYLFKYI